MQKNKISKITFSILISMKRKQFQINNIYKSSWGLFGLGFLFFVCFRGFGAFWVLVCFVCFRSFEVPIKYYRLGIVGHRFFLGSEISQTFSRY